MDILLVVDAAEVPERLSARARRRVDVDHGPLPPEIIADLRAHIPRSVGLVAPDSDEGRVQLARYRRPAPPGRTTRRGAERRTRSRSVRPSRSDPISDPGPTIQAVDSLLDLVGDTPLVRLDRIGRDLPGQLLAKLEFLNPEAASRTGPRWP